MGLVKNYIKNTNTYKEKLSEDYRAIFDEVMVYFRTSALPDKDIEMALQDILSSFLEAQALGKTINEVIGDNYKEFCENIIVELKASPKSKKRILLNNISTVFLISVIIVIIDYITDFVGSFIKYKTILINYSVNLDAILQIIMAIILVYIVFKFVRSSDALAPSNKKSKLKEFGIAYLIFSIIFLILVGSKLLKLEAIVLFNIKIYFIIPILYIIMKGFSYLANE